MIDLETQIDAAVRSLEAAFKDVRHDIWDGDTLNASPYRTERVLALKRMGDTPPTARDVDYFSFTAMSTVGGPETFKYFLPRFLAAALRDPFDGWVTDAKMILPKLEEAKFDTWDSDQREAVKAAVGLWTRLRLGIDSGEAEDRSETDKEALDLLAWAEAQAVVQ